MSKKDPAEKAVRDIRRKCPSSKQMGLLSVFHKGGENGGDKLVHGSGGISQPRAE